MAETLQTPLHARHLALKARMVPFAGWDMPVQYAGVIAEHTAVRTGVGVFDVSHMARFSFGGPGARELLEKVFTNNVGTMKDGQVRYGLVCNEKGGILDDVLVYKWPYGYAMIANASNREKILGWLHQHKSPFALEIQDATFSTALLAVQGPKAVDAVAGLFDADVSQLKYYFATPTRYRNTGCIVSRTGYTGEDGFEIGVSSGMAEPLWDDLLARGAVPCGLGARDTLRLEAAMPLYGHELNEATDPLQAGLGWAVKLDDRAFVGREAIQNAASNPFRPVRIGLELDGKRAAREGSQVVGPNGGPIGTVTSGSYVPFLQKSIAMAYVDSTSPQAGTKLTIDARGTAIPATLVPLPFYKRAK